MARFIMSLAAVTILALFVIDGMAINELRQDVSGLNHSVSDLVQRTDAVDKRVHEIERRLADRPNDTTQQPGGR